MVGRPEALRRFPWITAPTWDEVARRFPVRLPRAWLGDAHRPEDPRLLTALPDARELRVDLGDLADPVGDAAKSPVPWVVQKHPDRVLLLLTKRCHLYCRYCFRRAHQPGEEEDPSPEEWAGMLAWARRSGAREVILSGGDPLALTDARLFEAIDTLRPEVPRVRIHTRAPVTAPRRVTGALVRGLRARVPVWVVIHANRAEELEGESAAAVGRLVDGGIPVLNQAVLLAGVNDEVEVLERLCERLLELRVKPYYLHHPDAAPGNAHFRVDMRRGLALYEELRARVSGIGLPAYVHDPPDGSGKIAVEAWLARRSV